MEKTDRQTDGYEDRQRQEERRAARKAKKILNTQKYIRKRDEKADGQMARKRVNKCQLKKMTQK